MKICPKCHISKPLDDFHNDKGRKDGKYPNCKDCHHNYNRERYKRADVKEKIQEYIKGKRKNPEFMNACKERSLKFYSSIHGRARTLLNNARKSPAGQKECTVTLEHILKGISIGICPITGMKFDMNKSNNKKKNPLSPSIDRIDCSKGYTNENTRIVVWWYNMAKSELSDSEMLEMCKSVVKNA